MNSVLESNSKALAQLQRGDAFGAIKAMKTAVRALRSEAVRASTNTTTADAVTTATTMVRQVAKETTSINRAAFIRPVPILGNDIDSTTADNVFVFYCRAFELVPTQHQASEHSRCLVILLYNMGLSWQLASRLEENPEVAFSLTVHASRSYRMALDLASSSWSTTEFNEFRCVLLALANNLGEIYYQWRDHKNARDCLELALGILDYPDTSDWIPEDDFDVFYYNLAAFDLNDQGLLALAPAA